ncbi:MAG: GerMN domain-containing protein [Christensenellaceae bacterium]|nr:GerMN domain-containing protein [Christensenellaceae bacterium]
MRKLLFMLAVLIFALTGCANGEMPEEEIPVSAEDAMTLECAVYLDGGGHLVPMKVTSGWSDMYSDIVSVLKNGQSGKSGVIPESADVDITLKDRTAHVAISNMPETDKESAKLMADATAATLLQFGGIDAVSFEINGSTDFLGDKMTSPVTNVYLNPAYSIGDYKPFTVWYKSADNMLVPVTKEAPELKADVVVKAMMSELKNNSELSSLFPENTALKGVSVSGDTLMLDFSEELYSIGAFPQSEKLFFQALSMTCSQIEGIENVKVFINGTEYLSEYSFDNTVTSVFSNAALYEEQ